MPLRLGFDMDGVLADLNAALLREALLLFPGEDVGRLSCVCRILRRRPPRRVAHCRGNPRQVVPPSLRLSPRQQRQLWDAVKSIPNFWETLDETEPGIVARIAATAPSGDGK